MEEKIERNQRIYNFWKEEQKKIKNRRLSLAKIGARFYRVVDGQRQPIDASAIYRIIKRYEQLELDGMKEKENELKNEHSSKI